MGYARRNFMVPAPRVATWEELNIHVLEECRKRRERKLRGHGETIAQRFERDRGRLLRCLRRRMQLPEADHPRQFPGAGPI